MSKRTRRKFTDQYKAEAVAMVRSTGKSVHQVAKDLDLTETALRRWVNETEGRGPPVDGPPGEDTQARLKRLEEENRVLRMERDFLKKAAAFFARETK